MRKIKSTIKTVKDLIVYQTSYALAISMSKLTDSFPSKENYSLTDQIRRASRSIPANIAEGWAKRKHTNVFIKHLTDAYGSCEEMKTWLNFAYDLGYIEKDIWQQHIKKYEEISSMLYSLRTRWRKY